MYSTASRPILVDDIEFRPLSASEWRVSDTRQPPKSVDALIGFVARKGSVYYVTRLNHPSESTPFRTLEQVAAFIARRAAVESTLTERQPVTA